MKYTLYFGFDGHGVLEIDATSLEEAEGLALLTEESKLDGFEIYQYQEDDGPIEMLG